MTLHFKKVYNNNTIDHYVNVSIKRKAIIIAKILCRNKFITLHFIFKVSSPRNIHLTAEYKSSTSS